MFCKNYDSDCETATICPCLFFEDVEKKRHIQPTCEKCKFPKDSPNYLKCWECKDA